MVVNVSNNNFAQQKKTKNMTAISIQLYSFLSSKIVLLFPVDRHGFVRQCNLLELKHLIYQLWVGSLNEFGELNYIGTNYSRSLYEIKLIWKTERMKAVALYKNK